MGRKKLKTSLFLLIIGICSLSSCSGTNLETLNGHEFDISLHNDSSLIAKLNKEEKGYILSISGNGEMKDFAKHSRAPWYTLGSKLKEIVVNEGVQSIGTNAFNFLKLNSIYLPKSVIKINKNAFNDSTTIYSYASQIDTEHLNIYYYSETQPNDNKKYWHIVNDLPVVWDNKTYKTLFIGNSFTFYSDVPQLTENIACDLGFKFKSESVTKGSHRLIQFASETDEEGAKVYGKLKANNDYDFVILQEQSTGPLTQYSNFLSGAKTLAELTRTTQTNAKIKLYETWGYSEYASTNKITIPQMEEQLREKYENCAKEISADVHYVGKAFSKVYEENKDINLYFSDDKHPSLEGAYLSALVHVGSLFKVDVRATSYKPENMAESTAIALKNAAYQTVFNI